MKRFLAFTLCLAALLLASCKKEPYLTLSGPASVELSADGGSGTISFTGNNDWTASSSDSWVTVSPSSDHPFRRPDAERNGPPEREPGRGSADEVLPDRQ